MPIKQAGKKDIRQNAKRRARNLQKKRELHDLVKAFDDAIKADKKDEAAKLLPTIQKKLDKAAKTYFPKGRAARTKARMTKRLNTTKK